MSIANKLGTNFKIVLKATDYSKRHIHLYADYVELISLFSNRNYVTSSDLLDRFKDEGLIKQKKADEDQAEENDTNESFIGNIFRLLAFRRTFHDIDYPFEMIENKSIILKGGEFTPKQKIYLYLLISSNLSIFKTFESELTSDFEELSYQVLKNYLPNTAIIKQMGKNSDYKGNAINKLNQLKNDIKVKENIAHFNSSNIAGNQERGLDIIGWLPFKDNFSNKLIFMCQCACGTEWYKKKSETKRFESYWLLDCKPNHTMFIPFSLIKEDENSYFYQSDEIGKSLIFERGRILEVLKDFDFVDTFECMQLVDRCIEYEEDIV